MGLFSREKIINKSFSNNIFTSSVIGNSTIKKNLGMIKVTVSNVVGKFESEDELLKNEMIRLAKDKGGNAIINFRIESGVVLNGQPGVFLGYVIAYGDVVFIEYND